MVVGNDMLKLIYPILSMHECLLTAVSASIEVVAFHLIKMQSQARRQVNILNNEYNITQREIVSNKIHT